MPDEMSDTWRRTVTVDIRNNYKIDNTFMKKKEKWRERFEKCSPFVSSCNQMGLIKKHQPDMKEAQVVASEEALGLSDRVRTGGRMTTARASDDGDLTAVFLSLSGMADKENRNIFDLGS